jgi:hypothetical protein
MVASASLQVCTNLVRGLTALVGSLVKVVAAETVLASEIGGVGIGGVADAVGARKLATHMKAPEGAAFELRHAPASELSACRRRFDNAFVECEGGVTSFTSVMPVLDAVPKQFYFVWGAERIDRCSLRAPHLTEREADALRIIGQNANVGCNLFELPIHLENLDSDAMGASLQEALLQAASELAETELAEVRATSVSSQERLSPPDPIPLFWRERGVSIKAAVPSVSDSYRDWLQGELGVRAIAQSMQARWYGDSHLDALRDDGGETALRADCWV